MIDHFCNAILIVVQVINDLLDPTGQNLRVREDAQVSAQHNMVLEF